MVSNITASMNEAMNFFITAITSDSLYNCLGGFTMPEDTIIAPAETPVDFDKQFDEVEAMFQDWNPKAWEGLLEHVYAKKVASGEWVDRYVNEADKDPAKQSQRRMQQQINELQSQLKQRSSQEENNAASERQNRI